MLARPVVALTALVIALVAIFGKFAGAYAGARLRRLGSWEGIALGAGMNARGVVEVVIALTGLRLGVLNTTTYTIVVLVALVTSIMAPPVLRPVRRPTLRGVHADLRARPGPGYGDRPMRRRGL